mgnify:CR=1 FL=1
MAATNDNLKFELKEVAAWQLKSLRKNNEEVIVGVPSLQRGAVWDAFQLEMLWDSIFRGFPIGSIVLTEKIKNQITKNSVISQTKLDEASHHILDGQQRTNAITWGFDKVEIPIQVEKAQCLWLDLLPGSRLDIRGNSRKFLFRVTTKAHKWGYKASEKIEALNLTQRKNFTKKLEKEFGHFPMDAGLPIPLSYLWQFCDGEFFDLDRLKKDSLFCQVCEKNGISEAKLKELDIEYLQHGFKNAHQATLIGLNVTMAQIEDIEQIFLRLNRQGTVLDNDELIYSMIKAYWPEVEEILAGIEVHHTTEARLINMALRVALHSENSNLPVPKIQQIRNIFAKRDDSSEERKLIEQYFNDYIVQSLKWIDTNLVMGEDNQAFKLSRFLRSSIAWHSRDVFVWWLFVAKKFSLKDWDESKIKRVIAISLTTHWFVKDKTKMVRWLVKNDLFAEDFKILNDKTKSFFHGAGIIPPDEFKKFLQLENLTEMQLKKWQSLWAGTVAHDTNGNKNPEEERLKLEETFIFAEKLLRQRELLLYVQSPYIETFEYDPSNKLMWKGHSRPWDYDHILPSKTLNARGYKGVAGDYHNACKTWQKTIGNLVAVELSFNRSASDKTLAVEKYEGKDELHGFFDDIELKNFEIKLSDTKDFDKSKAFVTEVKKRILKIYQTWYDVLDIEKII